MPGKLAQKRQRARGDRAGVAFGCFGPRPGSAGRLAARSGGLARGACGYCSTLGSHSAIAGNHSTSSRPMICSTMNCIMPT